LNFRTPSGSDHGIATDITPRTNTMKRREFSAGFAGVAGAGLAGLGLAQPAAAQGGPVEGTHYTKLAQPVQMAASGKVEVVEFFSYGCPHCFALEPTVEQWAKHVPADVNFRRAPAGFSPQYEYHQRIFYALEAAGQLDAMHRKVFNAIHVDKKRLAKDDEVAAFISANGLDGAKFVETMKSFGVAAKARQAKQLTEAYRVEGVPALGVQGRWLTSSAMAGSHERTFAVVDYLIGLGRKTLS